MKTRSIIAILFILLAIAYCSTAATVVVKISQFPNTTSPASSDLFLLASGATNKNITWNQLKDAIGTNPATVTILNNLYVSNLYSTNIYSSNIITTNITVLNEYHGKTSFITNLYTTLQTTNYYLFTTNIYQEYPTYVNNEYVSNYFQTNVFLDTYVSNYFNTNQFLYLTNIYYYSTNLTVTNFYQNDTYVSNFFNTNIFNVDNTVSNFFTTNIYNTFNYETNITYQVSQNLTNPVFYGNAILAPYEDHPQTFFTVLSANGYDIFLDGWTGDITASGINADTFRTIEWTWDGPTNTMDMWTTDQYYQTYTPCSLTGFTDRPSDSGSTSYGWNGLLVITNASTTNILLTLPPELRIPERTNQVALSNATQGMLSIKYTSRSGTNGVWRQF